MDAGVALASELSLDAVLQRIVEAAAELTEARYAALGVIDPSRAVARAVHRHRDRRRDAGSDRRPPHGRGILGALIQDAKPLRLDDLTRIRGRSASRRNHPSMRTFLGVPILLRGVAYGNLYLTEKAEGAPFTDEDEELDELLSTQAAVAIENARLYESATRWLKQLESLNEVVERARLARPSSRGCWTSWRLVCESSSHARLVLIALPDREVISSSGQWRATAPRGSPGCGSSGRARRAGRVLERRRSERVDSMIEDIEVDQEVGAEAGSADRALRPDDHA